MATKDETEQATRWISVYGSPWNKDHGRPCGCSIRFRETDGYGVGNCPTHEAGPQLLAALEAVLENAGYVNGEAEPSLRALSVDIGYLERARAAVAAASPAS